MNADINSIQKIDFRKVVSKDDIAVTEKLAREIWNEHYVKIIGQAHVDYMLEKFQSRKAISEQIAHGYEYYIINHNGKDSGYTALAPEKEPATVLLSKIYLRKSSRGLGLGREIISFVEDLCRKRDIRKKRLS